MKSISQPTGVYFLFSHCWSRFYSLLLLRSCRFESASNSPPNKKILLRVLQVIQIFSRCLTFDLLNFYVWRTKHIPNSSGNVLCCLFFKFGVYFLPNLTHRQPATLHYFDKVFSGYIALQVAIGQQERFAEILTRRTTEGISALSCQFPRMTKYQSKIAYDAPYACLVRTFGCVAMNMP